MARKRKKEPFAAAELRKQDSSVSPAGGTLDPGWVARVREKLLRWYTDDHRTLPWRESRDPYRILVSEMMLVQTTVAAVIPYYARFLERFPDVRSLAEAEESEVLKLWEGLGYYRRARQLQNAARQIMEQHGGVFPEDEESVRALPGVGRYIAGAILSFAFDRPAPILEANTQRVVARWLACKGDLKEVRTQECLWRAAAQLVPQDQAGTFNQAFMELGALVCIPRAPLCLVCPVAAECQARALGIQERLPVLARKPPPLPVHEACALVAREGRWLVIRRGGGRLWEHFWEFPTIHLAGADPAQRRFDSPVDLAEGIRRLTGVRARVGPLISTVHYSVTRHRVRLDVYLAEALTGALTAGNGFVEVAWESPETLLKYPFASAHRRLIAGLAKRAEPPGGAAAGE